MAFAGPFPNPDVFRMRPIPIAVSLACAILLAACASSAPKLKEPIRLTLTVNALPGVNPDGRGQAAPIVVRVYELKDDGAFVAADFFSLQTQDKTMLADDIVRRDEFLLRPGERKRISRRADPATTTIGVLAAYRDLPNSVWREIHALPSAPDAAWYRIFSPKLTLNIDLDANAVRINEAKK